MSLPLASIRRVFRDRMVAVVASAAGLLLCALAIWAAGALAGRRALHGVVVDGRASAALHAALLRSELQKFRLVPFALADDPEARGALTSDRAASITTFDKRLERLSDSIRAAAIYLVAADGRTIAASNWNRPLSFVGSNYGFRAYFREALRRGGFEQFALGTVSRIPGLYIARRVETPGARGVVVLKVEFDQLEAEWAQSGSPAYVTDARGIVLITSVPQWRFLTEHPIDAAGRAALRRNLDFGNAPLTPLPIAERRAPGIVAVDDPALGNGAFVETVVPTATPGWQLHVLTPIGTSVRDAANIARLATGVVLLLAGLAIVAIARRRRRRRHAAAQAAADRAALEAEVEARTRDLRAANRHLTQEIADRRASEAKLQMARDQLVQANKLASLGQITAGVAHEINQPVAAIRSYADNGRLLLDHRRIEEAAGNLDHIVAMTERIGAITGELRGFARKARGTTEPIGIGTAIDGALLLLRDRIERQRVTIARAGDASAMVCGERVRLEQVLMNLLGNALDALEGGEGGAGGRIAVTVRRDAARVEVDIADDGPGLDPVAAATLFRPFTTTKAQGLGLGLIIARDIMRDLDGDLMFVPGARGACFRMRLKPA